LEETDALFSTVVERLKKNGDVVVKDEIGNLTVETYTSELGIRYKVLKRGDVVLSILYLKDAVALSKALVKRNHGE